MCNDRYRIALFEDSQERRDELIRELSSIDLAPWIIDVNRKFEGGTYESSIEKELQKILDHELLLIVCDRDLSNLKKRYIGLSCEVVDFVAQKLGIPICLYSRGITNNSETDIAKRLLRWTKGSIFLSQENPDKIAQEINALYHGFSAIKDFFEAENPFSDTTVSPSRIMARILGRPDLETRIGFYASGEQGTLTEILPFIERDRRATLIRRAPRIFGNWLYSSILRFPGILVNQTAAQSYLGVAKQDFQNEDVQALFESALYNGPFHELGKWWWRDRLDNLIIENNCNNGYEFIREKGFASVTSCPLGFYCMITEKAISADESQGGIDWFPAGADLARINKEIYNEIAPWIGVY